MKILKVFATCSLMIGLCLYCQNFAYASSIFMDGTFNNADWSSLIILDTGTLPASYSAEQVAIGGNPGEYRQLLQVYGGAGGIQTAHLLDWATYHPTAQGEIGSLDLSFDLILFDGGNSGGVGYGGLIFQNNSYYTSDWEPTPLYGDVNRWQSGYNLNLLATDFQLTLGTGPALPDFSSTGTPIQFGYFSTNGTALSSMTSTLSGIDNWSVTVNTVTTAPTPEPTTMILFGFGLLGIAGVSRKRTA